MSWTSLIIPSVSAKVNFPSWPDSGLFYLPMVFYFWVYFLFSLYFLIQGYKQNDGVIKRKIFYILIAALIGFLGGGTNWLPQTLGVYPFGSFFTWIYPILITYGIFVDEIRVKIKF